jgi:glycosyltransferase involved in cell wall biosynthesis
VNDRIRVATLYRTFGSAGDENRLVAFAKSVDRARFDHVLVVVMPPSHDGNHGGPMLDECLRLGMEIVYLEDDPRRWDGPARGARAAIDAARVVWRLVRLLVDRRIDVLDVRLAPAIPLGVLAGGIAGTPAIVGTQYYFAGWDTPRRRALANLVWPRLDALVCDSRYYLDELRGFLARPPRGVVIQNGVHPPVSGRGVEEMRRALGLPASRAVRVVGQIGRFVPWKGQRVLIEAARRVLAEERDVAFLVCGLPIDLAFRDEIVRRAADLGDRLRVVSYPGPAADVWRAIDVHAHAALYDSSPIAIHEGMALRRPVAATRVGGIPELVDHGRTGILVPPGDPGALAAAILRLLRDPAEAARLGAAARVRYERRHRPERMARATEALFEELVAEGRRRGRRRMLRGAAARAGEAR